MYQIYKNGTMLATVEKPNFIRKHREGFYLLCEEKEASGVALNGKVYHLAGRSEIEGAETVAIVETDGGSLVDELENASGIVFVTMAEKGEIDTVTAEEHVDLFSPWVFPAAYKVGNLRSYNGKLYKCISEHTSQKDWTPDAAVSLWVAANNPTDEFPAWSQPVGASDAYNMGDKVSHNGTIWESTVDANVWEPGVYGWTEVNA